MSSGPDLVTDARPEGAEAQEDRNQNSVQTRDYYDAALIFADEDYSVACQASAMITSIKLTDGTYPRTILHDHIKPISTEMSKYKLILETCSVVFIVATKNLSKDCYAEYLKEEAIAATRCKDGEPKERRYRVFKIDTQPKQTRDYDAVVGLESIVSYDVYDHKSDRSRSRLKVLFEQDSLLYTRFIARLRYDINEPSESPRDNNVHNESTENQESRVEIYDRNQNQIPTEPSDHDRSPPDATEEGGRSNPSHNDQNHSPSAEAHQGTQRTQEQTTTHDSASEYNIVSRMEARSGTSISSLQGNDLTTDAPETSSQTGQNSCDLGHTDIKTLSSEISNDNRDGYMKEQNKDPDKTHVLSLLSTADYIEPMRKVKMLDQHKASSSDEKETGAEDSGFGTEVKNLASSGSNATSKYEQKTYDENMFESMKKDDHIFGPAFANTMNIVGLANVNRPMCSSEPEYNRRFQEFLNTKDWDSPDNSAKGHMRIDDRDEVKSSQFQDEPGQPGGSECGRIVHSYGDVYHVNIFNSRGVSIIGAKGHQSKSDKTKQEDNFKEIDPGWLPPHRQKIKQKEEVKPSSLSTDQKSLKTQIREEEKMPIEHTCQQETPSNMAMVTEPNSRPAGDKSSTLCPAPAAATESGKWVEKETDIADQDPNSQKNKQDSQTSESSE